MGTVVWVQGYLRKSSAGFCQLFIFLDENRLVKHQSYSRVLISPHHTSIGKEQSQSSKKAKNSISKATILPPGKAKILTCEKRQDSVHSLKSKNQKHSCEIPKLLLTSKGREKSKWQGWPLHQSYLPSSFSTVPGLQQNIWKCLSNVRVSTAPSCLGKMLKNEEELKNCGIITPVNMSPIKADLVIQT